MSNAYKNLQVSAILLSSGSLAKADTFTPPLVLSLKDLKLLCRKPLLERKTSLLLSQLIKLNVSAKSAVILSSNEDSMDGSKGADVCNS